MEIENNSENHEECKDITALPTKYIKYTSECSKIIAKIGIEKVSKIKFQPGNKTKVTYLGEDNDQMKCTKCHFKKIYHDVFGQDESNLKNTIDNLAGENNNDGLLLKIREHTMAFYMKSLF